MVNTEHYKQILLLRLAIHFERKPPPLGIVSKERSCGVRRFRTL